MKEYEYWDGLGIVSGNHVNLAYNGDNYSSDKRFTYKFETDRRLNDEDLEQICYNIDSLIEGKELSTGTNYTCGIM